VAQKVRTLFIDDLDGSAAGGTVRFGLDGTEYEIDLNAGHARQLRDVLAACVRTGRRGQQWLPLACPRRARGASERVEYH